MARSATPFPSRKALSSHPTTPSSPSSEARQLQAIKKEKRVAAERRRQFIKSFFLFEKGAFYLDEYRELYNDTVNAVIDRSAKGLKPSQFCSSDWSIEEKTAFHLSYTSNSFSGLSKQTLKALAQKSAAELAAYEDALKVGVSSRVATDDGVTPLLYTQLSAARELSKKSCEAQNKAADALIVRQGCYEGAVELKKYEQYAMLSQESTKKIDLLLKKNPDLASLPRSEPSETPRIDGLLPALKLFNVQKWLLLSERVFMNNKPKSAEDLCWLRVTQGRQKPVIFATALRDFYNMVINFTRRVYCAALFQAQSRLRATSRRRRSKNTPPVTRRDVRTALNVLGLMHNTSEFWVRAARRNNLTVVRSSGYTHISHTHQAAYGLVDETELSLEEVERRLRDPRTYEHDVSKDEIPKASANRAKSKRLTQTDRRLPLSYMSTKQEEKQDARNAKADDNLELLDLRNDQFEERAMWTLLRQKNKRKPISIKLPEVPEALLAISPIVRGTEWRNHAEPSSAWEQHGRFPNDKPGKRHTKRRKIKRRKRLPAPERKPERVIQLSEEEDDHEHGAAEGVQEAMEEVIEDSAEQQAKLNAALNRGTKRSAKDSRASSIAASSRSSFAVSNVIDVEDDGPQPPPPKRRKLPARSSRQPSPQYAFQPMEGVIDPNDLYADSGDEY